MNSINHLAFITEGLNNKYKDSIFYSPNRTILPTHKKIIYKHLKKEQIMKNLSLKKY